MFFFIRKAVVLVSLDSNKTVDSGLWVLSIGSTDSYRPALLCAPRLLILVFILVEQAVYPLSHLPRVQLLKDMVWRYVEGHKSQSGMPKQVVQSYWFFEKHGTYVLPLFPVSFSAAIVLSIWELSHELRVLPGSTLSPLPWTMSQNIFSPTSCYSQVVIVWENTYGYLLKLSKPKSMAWPVIEARCISVRILNSQGNDVFHLVC